MKFASSLQNAVWSSLLLALSVTSLSAQSPQEAQPASDHTNATANLPVSVDKWTPPNEQITPMPLSERMRQGAVPKRGIASTVPGKSTADALLSGDGHMTIEVFGDPFAEETIFNQERLIAPWKDGKPMEAPKIADVLPEVRRLILAGDPWKAQEVYLDAAAKSNTPPSTGVRWRRPAFTMRTNTPDRHAIWDYLRTTDFERGEIKASWKDNAGLWVHSSFVSRPDNVVVQQMTAPSGSGINATIQLQTPAFGLRGMRSGGLIRAGERRNVTRIADSVGTPTVCDDKPWCQAPLNITNPGATDIVFNREFDPTHLILTGRYVGEGNTGYACVTRIISQGGSVTVENDSLVLHAVQSITLITRIEAYKVVTPQNVDELKAAVDHVTPDYEQLLARHRPGQAAVMDRVSLDFGGSSLHSMSGEEMLTDQRSRFGYNPALLENLFDMGRYWLYASTGDFPPMWEETNINVNLQNSPMVEGNLPETVMAYSKWMKDLLPDSETNARNIFGTRGADYALMPTVDGGPALHFVYIWGPHIYWTAAGSWLYSPMWDYYLATRDRQYLRDYLLPGLEQLALFYEDFLTEKDKDGHFVFVPSYSPENWPNSTSEAAAEINATMDISVCQDVFRDLIEAARTLGVDTDKIPKWQAILDNLPPYLMDSNGALKEWAWPTLTEDLDHRHLSHLEGAWPGDQFNVDSAPELARAASLASRQRAQGNASAHGPLHRALVAARLKDPYLLNFDLKQLLEQGYVNPSFTTDHNPYAFAAPDAQGSLPTIMMEMLIYSRPGVMELIPASPDTLAKGSAKGVVSRTQATIDDLSWDLNAHTVDVTLNSRVNQTIKLFVRKGIESVDAPDGVLTGPVTPGSIECGVRLPASQPVTLHFKIGDLDRHAWIDKVGR